MPRMNSDLTKHTKEVSSLARIFQRVAFYSVREVIIHLQRIDYSFRVPERENLLVRRDHDRFRSYMLKGKIAFTKLWLDEISTEFGYYNRFNEIQGILKKHTTCRKQIRNVYVGKQIDKKRNAERPP